MAQWPLLNMLLKMVLQNMLSTRLWPNKHTVAETDVAASDAIIFVILPGNNNFQ